MKLEKKLLVMNVVKLVILQEIVVEKDIGNEIQDSILLVY